MKRNSRTPRQRSSLLKRQVVALPAGGGSFREALSGSMQGRSVRFPVAKEKIQKQVQAASKLVSRTYTWLQERLSQTANKRLRVAETVSLGEKRFVALVMVEGREFLVGGGASGVSLLAQLGTASEPCESDSSGGGSE